MKTIHFRSLFLAILSILALTITRAVHAHGDEPRLEISADRMNPGGVIEVRGVEFEFEEQIALVLVGTEMEIPLGEITADTEGVFLQLITLPADLPEGTYHFRAVTNDHEILSPALLVQGPAVMNEEGGVQSQRDEEEPLLAPMPTFAPAEAAAPVPSTPVEATSSFDWNPILLVLVLLTLAGTLVVFGIKRKNKQ